MNGRNVRSLGIAVVLNGGIAVVLLAVAGSTHAAPSRPFGGEVALADRSGAFIPLATSFGASPTDVLSPAPADADKLASATVAYPGLFERESPPVLIWAAILMGAARVARAIHLRRRQLTAAPAGRRGHAGIAFAGRPKAIHLLLAAKGVQ